MNLFKRIKNRRASQADATEHGNGEKSSPTINEDPIKRKEEVLRMVCREVKRHLDAVEARGDRSLVIWLDTSQMTFDEYDNEMSRRQVADSIENEYGAILTSVDFRLGKPGEERHPAPIGKSGRVFVELVTNGATIKSKCTKAKISIANNAGGLKRDEYILSSSEMKEMGITAYNIGVGEQPKLESGYRVNHIAIDDNPNSPLVEKNRYVSRQHAHIGFSEELGFYLQAEQGGTTSNGNRTKIFRDGKPISIDNTMAKEPLHDGDLIELGKAVVLRYVELNEK